MPDLTRWGFSRGGGRIVRPDPLIRRRDLASPGIGAALACAIAPPPAEPRAGDDHLPVKAPPAEIQTIDDIQTNTQGECGTAREASTAALSGAASSISDGSPPQLDEFISFVLGPIGGSMAQASPPRRPPATLIKLPRYGEMEKRWDPHARGQLENGNT